MAAADHSPEIPEVLAMAGVIAAISAIETRVDGLLESVDGLRELLEASGIVLPHYQAYRLAVSLSRVDHAAAQIVMHQAKVAEADGQLVAFVEEP